MYKYLPCAKKKGERLLALLFSLGNPLSKGADAAGTNGGRQNSVQGSTTLEVLCMLLVSLSEHHFRCGEKLKWKLLHQNISFGEGTAWKNSLSLFLRNKEKLMKRFQAIMTKVSIASVLSPTLLPKWRKEIKPEKRLEYSKSGRPNF